jgi:transcriptional regulator with XRE-family HTH domain
MAEALSEDSNVWRRRLGIELRKLREAAKLGQRDAAVALEWSLSKVIRIETGAHGISVSDLKALLAVYKVTDKDQIDFLTAAARGGRGKPWWSDYHDIVTSQFARYLGYEGMASEFWVCHPFLVPGLLHTEAYATGLLEVYSGNDTARRLVELRMKRQERLFTQSDVPFTFIVGEEALYRWIGGPGVMREQLEHLLEADRRDNISIRVVPFTAGSHPGLCSPFIMLRIKGGDDELLFMESVNGDQLIQDDPQQIAEYTEYLEILREMTTDHGHTETLVQNQIERLRRAERTTADKGQ